ncbi:MAG TPA: metallophosphoesterase family protein [Verrucomicrobiae bacterium]|nr:metallophosphoesterase family protein [Verrucomicrobiae bacterium]
MKWPYAWVILIRANLAGLLGVCAWSAAADLPDQDRTNAFARAPYLQLATADSMTVVWRTEGESKPVVRYGLALNQLDQFVAATNIVTRVALSTNEAELKALRATDPALSERPRLHSAPRGLFQYEARITGLSPNTQYYYAVYDGARRLTEADPSYRFVTHPALGEARPARFWVVGDSGSGRAAQHDVYTSMLNLLKDERRPLDFCLHLGGMAFDRGRDVEFQTRFFEMYEPTLRQVVCWPTMGAQEGATSYGTNGVGPYYDAYVCPTRAEAGGVPTGTEAYYSFDYGRIHFICLDSYDLDRKPSGPMASWLRLDLERTRADWVIAFFHHPPYTKGTHDSDQEKQLIDMRMHIMPILESGGVDIVLTAHSHIYERSMLMDQAYDTPTVAHGAILDDAEGDPRTGQAYRKSAGLEANGGTIQVVAGNGGAPLGRKGTMPVMRKILVEHGSVIIDIDGDTLQGRMLNKFGEVNDAFGLIKRGRIVHRRPLNPWRPPPYIARNSSVGLAAQPPEDFFVLIPSHAQWTYLAGDHPEGTKWTEIGFDASGWKKGEAPFGYEYKEVRTLLDDMKDRYSVIYIRHEFELKRADLIVELGLMINYDDGFIAYLNGHEVLRQGVGQGSGKQAREIKSHDATRYSYFRIMGFENHLRAGLNVLAIEGHNTSIESHDFLIDPYLLMEE